MHNKAWNVSFITNITSNSSNQLISGSKNLLGQRQCPSFYPKQGKPINNQEVNAELVLLFQIHIIKVPSDKRTSKKPLTGNTGPQLSG